MTPDWVTRTWSEARDYCAAQGGRLPTKDELLELYNAYPAGQIAFVCAWSPTDITYLSSSESSPDFHYNVSLFSGIVSSNVDSRYIYVACVR